MSSSNHQTSSVDYTSSSSAPGLPAHDADCKLQPLVSHLHLRSSSQDHGQSSSSLTQPTFNSNATPTIPAEPLRPRAEEWWELSDKRADEGLSQHGLLSSAVLSSAVFLLGLVLSGTLTFLPIDSPAVDVRRLMFVLLLLFAAVFVGLFMMTVTWVPFFFIWRWNTALKLAEADDADHIDSKTAMATSTPAATSTAAAARHRRREEHRQRRELVLQANNVLFSGLLVAAVALQIVAIILLMVVVVCESAAFRAYGTCHDDTLTALCCMVGGWLLIALLTTSISLCAAPSTSKTLY